MTLICPRCRQRRRFLQDSIEASRDDRRHRAPFCEPCLIEDGWQKHEEDREVNEIHGRRIMPLVWWDKPLTAQEEQAKVYAESDEEFIRRVNGLSAKERDIAKAEIMANAHRGGVRQPSAMRLRPRVKA